MATLYKKLDQTGYVIMRKRADKLDTEIKILHHSMAIYALEQASKGNFPALVDHWAWLKGKRLYTPAAFVEWACKFGKVKFDKDTGTFSTKKRGKWNIEMAAEIEFWEYSDAGQPEVKAPIMDALLKSLAIGMAKREAIGAGNYNSMSEELVDKLAMFYVEAQKSEKVVDFVEKYEAQQVKKNAA